MREITLATHNHHKTAEFRDLLPGIKLLDLPGEVILDPETGATFLENARIKASSAHHQLPGRWILADDSGLCVAALQGAPGIHSARYAGEAAGDHQNVEALLEALQGHSNRSATFICVLVLMSPEGEESVFRGRCSGSISTAPGGSGGFGYDPVFVPSGLSCSFALLPADEKNRISHRALAARALRDSLERVRA